MNIGSIRIRGYKSIENQEVKLGPINLLIGGNGVGKSNFISSFTLLRNLYEMNLQTYVESKGRANALLHFGVKNTQQIVLEILFSGDDGKKMNSFHVTLQEAQGKLLVQSVDTYFYSGASKFHQKHSNTLMEESTFKQAKDRQASYVNPFLQQFEVFHFHDTGDTSPLKQSCEVNDNRKLKKDGSNLPAFLYRLKKTAPKSFRRIEKLIQSIAPFFDHFILEPLVLSPEYIKLEWKEKGSIDTTFNAYHLSDGTLRFIALVTLLMQPEPPATIIIDEPELGLHPVAINKLAGLIRIASKKSQIIISTQSVNLVNNFEPEDIIVADRKGKATTFKSLDKEKLGVWLEDYTMGEVWEKNIIGGQPL
ncbi:AAA family ATPase [Flammeovirga kamogawensis]|uniref:AAA family ATPase n=1 Tax=Flammeovirga kamogawensis TaxID=373891 RepID=A0ABX8GTE9_9BACT|nr:AAA family ATPase [Flammeovirga kamogawensis]MBB6463334.1 putative ATPase [Flammeovirga kamogawensis]QWG06694.1 AAA family ATPase [Flammeovirga kamogawensis]TRX68516.1 AAA family ATPase [Flammeovirga kamogawensis]